MEITSLLNQRLSLSKNLVFSLKILAFNSYDLFQFVDDAALSNPAIFFSNRKFLHSQFSSEDQATPNISNVSDELIKILHENIENSSYDNKKKIFLNEIVDSYLDENFLLKKTEFLQKFTTQQYYECQRYFKNVSPAGIAACNLQERFKHQLEFLGLKKSTAYRIIDESWKYFLIQKYTKVQKLLKIDELEIQAAVKQIRKICKPNIIESHLDSFAILPQNFIYPDVILKSDGSLEINERYLPKIKIDENFINSFGSIVIDRKILRYKEEKIKQAKNLLHAIQKRNQTLLSICSIVLNYKKKIIENNHSVRKRLTLKDIAYEINLSQSTVSRALQNKTILTLDGIKPLSFYKN